MSTQEKDNSEIKPAIDQENIVSNESASKQDEINLAPKNDSEINIKINKKTIKIIGACALAAVVLFAIGMAISSHKNNSEVTSTHNSGLPQLHIH